MAVGYSVKVKGRVGELCAYFDNLDDAIAWGAKTQAEIAEVAAKLEARAPYPDGWRIDFEPPEVSLGVVGFH